MRLWVIVLLSVAWPLVSRPSSADWLVMRDGTRVETAGAWEEKGRQVIFTLPGGALATVRLAEVDLEASLAASAEKPMAKAVSAAAASGGAKPILRLTNEDLPPAEPDPEAETEADAGEGKEVTGPVRVVFWESRDSVDYDGLEIVGSLRNDSERMVASIQLMVTSLDDENNAIVKRAFLNESSLAPGQTTSFRAFLKGVFFLQGDPTFEATSEAFSIGAPSKPEGAASDEGDLEAPEARPPAGETGR